MRLDYTIKDPHARVEAVEDIIESTHDLSPSTLSYMADYLLFVSEKGTTKDEKSQEYPIVTRNREITVSKRQVSYEEMSESDDYGSDSVCLLMAMDKNQILDPKDPITEKDLDEIPGMRQKEKQIASLKSQIESAKGRRKYMLKHQLIATYQEQYTLKFSWMGGMRPKVPNASKFSFTPVPDEDVWVDADGFPHAKDGTLSFLDPHVVSAFLDNYVRIRFCDGNLIDSELRLMALDLERLINESIDNPVLYDVAVMKMCGCSNAEVAHEIESRYGISHFHRYYSTIWKRRIPRLIARHAQKEYVMNHHDEMGFTKYKVCARCGREQLAHPMFFCRNSSKDGYYSICKSCRSK